MAKRVLAIGVGGTGKAALTILKERLEEMYGQVPDNVVLLSLDTDSLREVDTFAGTRLNPETDERGREPEFREIVSRAGERMDHVFEGITSKRTLAYMNWLEHDKLSRTLAPTEMDIHGGAQQRRPVGRVALFQRWEAPIRLSISNAIARMYGDLNTEQERPADKIIVEQSKRLVFIIGSMAGGTGSGFLIDVANLVRDRVSTQPKWQSVDVSAIIVLPDAFAPYAKNNPETSTNLEPNSFAALRELDRFNRAHSTQLPYMIRYDEKVTSITWNTNQILDHVYLVDTASPHPSEMFDLRSMDPMRGVFPVIADFVAAHIDNGTADSLASWRSNAGMHYNKETGALYSSFNLITFLFPVDDIIESFSYRFLQTALEEYYLAIPDARRAKQVEQAAQKAVEASFTRSTVGDRVVPNVIQKAIAVTRPINPERADVSWTGLFNLIALSDSAFAEDYSTLQNSLDLLNKNMSPSKSGENKDETFDEGYTRLMNFAEMFMTKYLGPRYDADNEEARAEGEWDQLLARYRGALCRRFAEALDTALLQALNERDANSLVIPNRLPYARYMVAYLKSILIRFRKALVGEYSSQGIDTRIRQTSEQLRDSIVAMQDTKDSEGFLIFKNNKARQAQEAYIGLFSDRMQMLLHQKIFKVVVNVLDALGAQDKDADHILSVTNDAALDLEKWQATLADVHGLLVNASGELKRNRGEKNQVKMRQYLTSDEYEEQLYNDPRHFGYVFSRVMGQVQGDIGLAWQRTEPDTPLHYRIETTWANRAVGAENIFREFFRGAKSLFQVVRQNVSVAERIADHFPTATHFVNYVLQINEPLLLYKPANNDVSLATERYVSFNLNGVSEHARRFLEEAGAKLRNEGISVVEASESRVSCPMIEISRGAALSWVEQFTSLEMKYRMKVWQGRESLHLFPEEQLATMYEKLIQSLSETENKQRLLSPELVAAMGDEKKLRLFAQACAYGVIHPGSYFDEEAGTETTEVYLELENRPKIRLSNSLRLRTIDERFITQTPQEQEARLYLNALQNFVLKFTEKLGISEGLIDTVVKSLKDRAVDLSDIENPLTLKVTDVGRSVRLVCEGFGPNEQEEPDKNRREAENARRRAKCLQGFVNGQINKVFKVSPAQRIKDFGTVLHLILKEEIQRLNEQAAKR